MGQRTRNNNPPTLCTVEDCERSHLAKGYCRKHYTHWYRHGYPVPIPREPAYVTVHMWLRKQRGPASGYDCVDCGGPASDWSYDEPEGYSPDLSRYQPRCRGCHLRKDGNSSG